MELSADTGLMLFAYTAEAGSRSAEALNLLGSWSGTLGDAEKAAQPTEPDPRRPGP